jgi:hypothetical protein
LIYRFDDNRLLMHDFITMDNAMILGRLVLKAYSRLSNPKRLIKLD